MSQPQTKKAAMRALSLEYKNLQENPVEGFRVKLIQDNDIFKWGVSIFGPPDTIYQGGYFKAVMEFPNDYPYSPPKLRFLMPFWHPNVYENGLLCISILHPPVDDPASGMLVSEQWNPTQTVRTILLSVISLLNEPNTSSPANVDASVMYVRWKESQGTEKEYETIVEMQVQRSRDLALKEGIVVPTTVEDYCDRGNVVEEVATTTENDLDDHDFFLDDYCQEDDDDDSDDDVEDDDEDEDNQDDDDDDDDAAAAADANN